MIAFVFGFHNKGDRYAVESSTEGFTVDGELILKDDGCVLNVSHFSCHFDECLNEKINTIQYSVVVNDTILFRSGILDYTSKKEKITLDDYLKSIIIDIHDVYKFYDFNKNNIIGNSDLIYVHIELILENGEIRNYDIYLQIVDKK